MLEKCLEESTLKQCIQLVNIGTLLAFLRRSLSSELCCSVCTMKEYKTLEGRGTAFNFLVPCII